MTAKPKRERERFDIGDIVPLSTLVDEPSGDVDPQDGTTTPTRRRKTKAKRPSTTKLLRTRAKGRNNTTVDVTSLVEALLRCEEFFEFVAEIEIPPGDRGPEREYSAVTVWLWQCLFEDVRSIHRIAAYFSHELIWGHVARTLEEAWPDDPTRRVPANRPMSRDQFCRHRKHLRDMRPEAAELVRRVQATTGIRQSLAMGYFEKGRGSLANPDRRNILYGDGTKVRAMTDAIEGDKVVNSDGEVQQARHDADAVLAKNPDEKEANPAYTWVSAHVHNGHEQERVTTGFARSDDLGEARTFESIAKTVKDAVPHLPCSGYDMAVQGASANRLYSIGIHPITKIPRDSKNNPASHLIEKQRAIKGHSGRTHHLQIYGLDGVVGIKAHAAGEDLFVPVILRALREPRTGTVQGFYEIPNHAIINPDLHGREIMVRLDGLTDDGRQRPQYIRWFTEHTERGRELLGHREGTESEHSTIKVMLPWKRARSFGDFNNTLDMAGYFFVRNMRAALAHERRTGNLPIRSSGPPDPALAAA